MRYYRTNFDKRVGGDFLEIYDDNFNRIDTIKAIRSDSGYLYRETELPIDLDSMVRIVGVMDTMSSVLKTEPINDKWLKVVEMPDYTPEQLEIIGNNIE